MTSVKPDPEEVERTRSEGLLAVVLGAFVLVGLLWGYAKLDEVDRPEPQRTPAASLSTYGADRAMVQDHSRAVSDLRRERRGLRGARSTLELRREDYRTAIEAGDPVAASRGRYEQARETYAESRRRVADAQAEVASTSGPARAAQDRINQAGQSAASAFRDDLRAHDRLVFALRLLLAIASLGASYLLLGRLRRSRSRYLPLGLASVGASAVLGLVLAFDYLFDYVEFTDVGPLTISIVGSATTIVAFVALQRYIAKAIPARRVRRRQCPFCGFPVGENSSCEGCGRRVIGECSSCQAPRRVGTPHCGACGAA